MELPKKKTTFHDGINVTGQSNISGVTEKLPEIDNKIQNLEQQDNVVNTKIQNLENRVVYKDTEQEIIGQKIIKNNLLIFKNEFLNGYNNSLLQEYITQGLSFFDKNGILNGGVYNTIYKKKWKETVLQCEHNNKQTFWGIGFTGESVDTQTIITTPEIKKQIASWVAPNDNKINIALAASETTYQIPGLCWVVIYINSLSHVPGWMYIQSNNIIYNSISPNSTTYKGVSVLCYNNFYLMYNNVNFNKLYYVPVRASI